MERYELKGRYNLKVKELLNENGIMYYVVDAGNYDCLVKVYEFQKTQAKPLYISCIYKGVNGADEPMFMQDVAPLIQQQYKIGSEYNFKVRSDKTYMGYYEVQDKNGFIFRLNNYGKSKLYINQMVRCRVDEINLIRVYLSIVAGKQDEYVPFWSPEKLIQLSTSTEGRTRALAMFKKLPSLREARSEYLSGNALWVVKLFETVDKLLPEWLNSPLTHRESILRIYYEVCLNLLEKSDYLNNCTPDDQAYYQDKLSNAATHAEDYLEALHLIKEEKEEEYVRENLERLKKTGYLFKPEKTMRTIMSLITLRQMTVRKYIRDIYDIILDNNSNHHFMKLFSNAFIEMLDVYIHFESERLNYLSSAYDTTSKQMVEEMLTALVMQLLLTRDKHYKGSTLCRSRLYRYASFLQEDKCDELLDKAYNTLFAESAPKIDLGWNDLNSIHLLLSKLLRTKTAISSNETMKFDADTVTLRLKGNEITFSPLQRGTSMRKAYADDMMPWHSIQFMLNDRLQERAGLGTKEIRKYQLMWNELEHSLFARKQNVARHKPIRNVLPDKGENVNIRIVREDDRSPGTFICQIEDNFYGGRGTIRINDIVPYNVWAKAINFRDEEGLPYLLPVYVKKVNLDGTLQFDMKVTVDRKVRENANIYDEVVCFITSIDHNFARCVSEFGYGISFPVTSDMVIEKNTLVWVRIDDININCNLQGSFVEPAEEIPDQLFIINSFQYLMEQCSDGKRYEGVDEDEADETEETPEALIPAQYVAELMHIIARHAVAETDQISTYNYLSVSGIISRMLQQEDTRAYYDNRRDIVKMIHNFGRNERIDDSDLNTILEENTDLVSTFPDIKNKLTQLKIINRIDKDWDDDFLWQTAREKTAPVTSRLARLVLSYNMLRDCNMYEERQVARRKVFQLMDIHVSLPDNKFVATEDQFTELKTSMVYSAERLSHMQPDIETQIRELMTVVCSMLNARGGTLYIGVNNSGYATGLHDDFVHLNHGVRDYDLRDVKDKFDLNFHNAVHDRLSPGVIAGENIRTAWIEVSGEWIYKAEINPCAELVTFENSAYVRQGTSKRIIPENQIQSFKKSRRLRLNEAE